MACVLATLASQVALLLARLLDPAAVVGLMPSSMEPWIYLGMTTVTIVLAAPVAIAFAAKRRRPFLCWALAVLATVLGAGSPALIYMQVLRTYALGPVSALGAIAELESRAPSFDVNWELAALLAMVGEEGKARDIVSEPLSQQHHSLDGSIEAHPWEDAFDRVARTQRLVLIMEAHHVSEHRELIRRILPIFARHGFRRYAAEGLSEDDAVVRQHEYPGYSAGYYTSDPRFAGILRDALKLGFELVRYEVGYGGDIDGREEHQANVLAQALRDAPEGKLLVHVGFHHLLKYTVPGPQPIRWMAARLWEKTGVEPYTIYQLSSRTQARDDPPSYRQLREKINDLNQPMLITPPSGLLGDPFNLYKRDGRKAKAVDAIVLHPPLRTDGPDQRPGFLHAPDRRKIRGRLAGGPRPALVTARAHNASHDSVPLDQVILREGREWFELWVPGVEVTLHAYSLQGQLTVDHDAKDTVLILTPHAR